MLDAQTVQLDLIAEPVTEKRTILQTPTLQYIGLKTLSIMNYLFDPEFVKKAMYSTLSPSETIKANVALISYLFPSEICLPYLQNDSSAIRTFHQILILKELNGKESLVNQLTEKDCALIVIRPEMLDFRDDIYQFLIKNDLEIIYSKTTSIDVWKYFLLYPEGFTHPSDSIMDFPTRTLLYINNQLEVLLLKRKGNKGEKLPDILNSTLKGRRGNSDQTTLRGSIVLSKQIELGILDNPLPFLLAMSIDPIMAYRHIADGNLNVPPDHIHSEYPLIFYTGQGIHIPDSIEFYRDAGILFSTEELTNIINLLN